MTLGADVTRWPLADVQLTLFCVGRSILRSRHRKILSTYISLKTADARNRDSLFHVSHVKLTVLALHAASLAPSVTL